MSSLAPYADARTLILSANLVPITNIHWSNEPFAEPNPPALWLSVEAFSPHISMLDVGANAYQEQGVIRVMCIAPAGTGSDALRTLAKNVANTFRALGPRNPYYLAASISEASASDDGLWAMLCVSVDFRYEDHT